MRNSRKDSSPGKRCQLSPAASWNPRRATTGWECQASEFPVLTYASQFLSSPHLLWPCLFPRDGPLSEVPSVVQEHRLPMDPLWDGLAGPDHQNDPVPAQNASGHVHLLPTLLQGGQQEPKLEAGPRRGTRGPIARHHIWNLPLRLCVMTRTASCLPGLPNLPSQTSDSKHDFLCLPARDG